jgi:hypothetical protein
VAGQADRSGNHVCRRWSGHGAGHRTAQLNSERNAA